MANDLVPTGGEGGLPLFRRSFIESLRRSCRYNFSESDRQKAVDFIMRVLTNDEIAPSGKPVVSARLKMAAVRCLKDLDKLNIEEMTVVLRLAEKTPDGEASKDSVPVERLPMELQRAILEFVKKEG